jgi:polyisoprenyl-teichoic acid--peptidoglycan teichoic acid transferase
MLRLIICFIISAALFSCPLSARCDEEMLSEEEVTLLLRELLDTQNSDAEFLVLPDGYEIPKSGIDRVYNLLIIGVDTNNANLNGRSDTMILASLDLKTGKLKLISFMRDLYVAIPGRGHNKLNAAYSFGGPALLLKTLKSNFGVVPDGYLAVDFSLMADLVDAIGGVEIAVEDKEVRPLNGILEYYNYKNGIPEKSGRLQTAGLQLLTGKQAMAYARIRKLDSDFIRVERQQRVISAIFSKMLTLGITASAQIAITFAPRVGTNIAVADTLDLLGDALACDLSSVENLRVPVDGGYSSKMLNGTYYIVPNYARNTQRIAEFLAD